MSKQAKVKNIFNVISGNFLEMYDFTVYGYYADHIGKAFFPAENEFISLLSAFLVFGMSYLIRPIGALVLGSYIDNYGRKQGLFVTLILMSIGTLLIACTPTYSQIGVFAPIIIVLARLLQGFSAGAELGGVSIYLYEIAPTHKRGFYVSWQSASQQLAVIFAAVIGFTLNYCLNQTLMDSFGWRIPFIIGLAVIPYLFWLRNRLEETDIFKKKMHSTSLKEIFYSIIKNWKIIVIGMLMTITTSCCFYMITAFFKSYTKNELGFNDQQSFLILILVGISNLFWIPIIATLSDKIGRRPVLITFSLLICTTFYPVLSWLVNQISLISLLMCVLWFSFMYAGFNAALVITLAEIIPTQIRASAFSIAYSLAVTLGGFTPAISQYLIKITNNKSIPGIWITLISFISLITITFILPKYSKDYLKKSKI